ncbi:MAG TPA: GNAT family N-acetyltransferase [Candidatus Saccharimonadales bacterium]|nr:GNAT family N-acetyltransferase [Candidatus Saccharimonadales bacterium]
MKIINYEAKYKKELAGLFDNFHNYMVAIHSDGVLKPFATQDDVLSYVDKMINDSETMNGFIYLAMVDDKIAGFTQGIIQDHSKDDRYHLVANPGSEGWIGELYVEKNYRKRGIGRALFEKAKKHFETNGCRAARLYVLDNNKDAFKLYTNLGMKARNIEMDLKLSQG